jgi:HPt (histidine-containing phosphotransfer) domain-containing protein
MHIIDINALSAMLFNDATKVQLVIDALIQRIPEWQAEVGDYVESNNLDETRKLCHRIRGAAGSIKAEKLADSATVLGEIIKNNQLDGLQAGFANLNTCLEELLTQSPHLAKPE